jgi:hypothetical protein
MTKLFATAVPFTSGSKTDSASSTPMKNLYDMPVVNADGEVRGDFIVWEDSLSVEQMESTFLSSEEASTPSKAIVTDENILPVDEDIVS